MRELPTHPPAYPAHHTPTQGWLLKQSSNFRREFKRRFFCLDSTGMLYYW